MNSFVHTTIPSKKIDKDFYSVLEQKYGDFQNNPKPAVPFDSLEPTQKEILMSISKHIATPVNDQLENQRLIIISGAGGTGKSLVGQHLKYRLQGQRNQNSDFNYINMAYSGTAAAAINGQTIHSSLLIPAYLSPMSWASLLDSKLNEKFLNRLKNVQFIVVDEFGMAGLRCFHYISEVFKVADPCRWSLPFAGRSVVLIGDPRQLQPIKDYALFDSNFGNAKDCEILLSASQNYRKFKTVYILKQIYRQAGNSSSDFREVLTRLRTASSTEEDINLIRSRMKSQLPAEEQLKFQNALHVFPRRISVDSHNLAELNRRFSREQIITIPNTPANLLIARGCRVSLTRNLSIKNNIVNGSEGLVQDVEYHPTGKLRFVLVKFDQYRGNVQVKTTSDGKDYYGLPVFYMKESEMINGRLHSYYRMPLCLQYAATIHKTQSKTLPLIAIQLEEKALSPGNEYVALSRVKNINDIMILDEEIPSCRFAYSSYRDRKFITSIMNEETRLANLAANTKIHMSQRQ